MIVQEEERLKQQGVKTAHLITREVNKMHPKRHFRTHKHGVSKYEKGESSNTNQAQKKEHEMISAIFARRLSIIKRITRNVEHDLKGRVSF